MNPYELRLPGSLAVELERYAATYDREVGGVLLLDRTTPEDVRDFVGIGNVAGPIAREAYVPNPSELIAVGLPPAHAWGLFHSHVLASEQPSRGDRDAVWSGRLAVNLIYSVATGRFGAYVGVRWEPIPVRFVDA